jgi:hypothetical protein
MAKTRGLKFGVKLQDYVSGEASPPSSVVKLRQWPFAAKLTKNPDAK